MSTPAPARFVLVSRVNLERLGRRVFLPRPARRGALEQLPTPELEHAASWSEKSGAYKFLKRHRRQLSDYRVLAVEVPPGGGAP